MLCRYTWKNYHSVFDKHTIYVKNDTQNTYEMSIIKYAERVSEMFELDKYLPPPSKKNEEYHDAARENWDFFLKDDICKEIKDVMPEVMKKEVEDKEYD